MGVFIRGSNVVTLSISASSAEIAAALSEHTEYLITSDADCFFRIGPTGTDATVNDTPLWSKQYLSIRVPNATESYVNAITASGSGTLYLIPVGA